MLLVASWSYVTLATCYASSVPHVVISWNATNISVMFDMITMLLSWTCWPNISVAVVSGWESLTLRLLPMCPLNALCLAREDAASLLCIFFLCSSGLRPASALWFPSHGPVANQSLSFCLAVMHTNSQQHILISPESKAHQSQLTGLPGPARAILKKCFILPVRHMWIWADDFATYVWEFLLPPRHLCSRYNDISGGCSVMAAVIICNRSKARFDLRIKQTMFPESLW